MTFEYKKNGKMAILCMIFFCYYYERAREQERERTSSRLRIYRDMLRVLAVMVSRDGSDRSEMQARSLGPRTKPARAMMT